MSKYSSTFNSETSTLVLFRHQGLFLQPDIDMNSPRYVLSSAHRIHEYIQSAATADCAIAIAGVLGAGHRVRLISCSKPRYIRL